MKGVLSVSILNDGSIICVCCKERFNPQYIKKSFNNLGICSECIKKIEPVPLFNPIEGIGNVNYFISGYYYNDTMKTLIHRYKFGSEYALSGLFSSMLYDRIKDISELHEFDFITSVPISRKRFLKRGFNQAELIARKISEMLDIPYVICIHKSRHTIAQSMLKKKMRADNIRDAFIADAERVNKKRILLVDDIITTGSTMNECARELFCKNAEFIAGISLAITKRKVISEALSILGSGF